MALQARRKQIKLSSEHRTMTTTLATTLLALHFARTCFQLLVCSQLSSSLQDILGWASAANASTQKRANIHLKRCAELVNYTSVPSQML